MRAAAFLSVIQTVVTSTVGDDAYAVTLRDSRSTGKDDVRIVTAKQNPSSWQNRASIVVDVPSKDDQVVFDVIVHAQMTGDEFAAVLKIFAAPSTQAQTGKEVLV